jgi:hypothetical protein
MSMKVLSSAVVAIGVLCGISTAAYAQERTAVVTVAAPIYVVPDASRVPLRLAAVNTVLRVRSEEGPWLQVEFQDPQFGRRVGYVETQRVRVNNPALEPMNLSVERAPVVAESDRLAPAPQQITAPAPQQITAAAPAVENGRQHTREGFMFNVGLGFGSLGCQDCGLRTDGLSGGMMAGWAITPKVVAGVGTSGFTRNVDGALLQLGTFDGRFRFYFKETGPAAGLHVNLGAGIGHFMVDDFDREFGFGLMLGAGWDIRVGRNVSLTPFWNGFAMSNSVVDGNVGQIGIGVTIH